MTDLNVRLAVAVGCAFGVLFLLSEWFTAAREQQLVGLPSSLTSSATESGTKQTSGASFMFVMDVKDWDNSTGLSVPGNSAQPLAPHCKDLTSNWGEGKYFPLLFSRPKVEQNSKDRLMLVPARRTE